MTTPTAVTTRLRPLLVEYVTYAGVSPQEEQHLAEHLSELSRPLLRRLGWILVVVALAFLPFDLWLYGEDERFIRFSVIWRTSMLSAAMFAIIALGSEWGRRHVWSIATVSLCAIAGGVGYASGLTGGLHEHWFFGVYLIPPASLGLVGLKPGPRLIATSAMATAWLVGFWLPERGELAHPYLHSIVMNVVAAVVGAVIFGHVIYHLLRTNFFKEQELQRQRARTDALLFELLPPPIAHRLKRDRNAIAEAHEEVTVLFADLVGFTAFCEQRKPTEVVEVLNEIFTQFDALAEAEGVEKIKTMGDAYMLVSGLPEHRDDHALAAIRVAIGMREIIESVAGSLGEPLAIRIGVHTGPVVAGVIGSKRFVYDVWGDTVNVASRMESHGLPGEIQVSGDTWSHVHASFRWHQRGEIALKGKAAMRVFVLADAEPTPP